MPPIPSDLTITLTHLMIISLCLFIFGFAYLIDGVAKTKGIRAKAELKRQMRAHRAALAHERDMHAREVAALRDRLRIQDDGPKPFDAITACRFNRRKLMNLGEYRLYCTLQDMAPMLGVRVWPQVPLGEILSVAASSGSEAERRRASQEIQGKRVDFALTDSGGRPLALVELQGTGHYQGNASWRDQIKQAVCRTAGLPLIEIRPDMKADDLQATLGHALGVHRIRKASPRPGPTPMQAPPMRPTG